MAGLYHWWTRYGQSVMYFAVCVMAFIAALRLGYEFWRLVGMTGPKGAIDLVSRYEEVRWWFAEETMKRISQCPGYPPASYVFLWLPLGWLPLWPARFFWALTSIVLLAGIIRYFLRESKAESRLEQVFLLMIFLSAYPTAVTIGNGQMGIHLLAGIIGAVLLTQPGQRVSPLKDVVAAVFFLAALTKVSFSAPFFFILLFMPGRFRPAILVVLGYVLLTFFSASFQPYPITELVRQFISFCSSPAAAKGGAHLIRIMNLFGLTGISPIISVSILVSLGVWIWFYRQSHPILLMAVTGITARLCTYHRMYDDILIFLPLVALYRISKLHNTDEKKVSMAGILFGAGLLGMEMPATIGRMAFPWNLPYDIGQTALWTAMLVFLLFHARNEKLSGISLQGTYL